MIDIEKKKNGQIYYYNFSMVNGDTGHFTATPYVNNQEYTLQTGDKINFCIAAEPNGTPIVSADAVNKVITITPELSSKLSVGDYYADVTLVYANGNKDTFIPLPISSKGSAISNFHVVDGV